MKDVMIGADFGDDKDKTKMGFVLTVDNVLEVFQAIKDELDPLRRGYKYAEKVPFKIVEPLQLPYPQRAEKGLTDNVQ